MIWAYWTDRLPYECYNEFDNLLLGRVPRAENGHRVQKFRGWMLAMSDQQLLSGLALAIVINMVRNGVADLDAKVTGYSYNNAVILAFFSCMIHLASLSTLRVYLKERGKLKHIRAGLMLCVLILILQGLAETWWEMDPYSTLRCAVAQFHAEGYLQSGPTKESVWNNISTIMGLTTFLFLLASGYVRRILALYSNEGGTVLKSQLVPQWAGHGITKYTELEIQEAKRNLALRWSSAASFYSLFSFIVLPSFTTSFVFEIIWTVFYFAMGLTQMAYFLILDYDSTASSRISFEPGFGQLLPLILLGLPILAVCEGYSGKFLLYPLFQPSTIQDSCMWLISTRYKGR